ncbi:MAG: YaiO family outer membrane beta-barrel protein [Betaproteobacteria bacterium]|nr:YaiO family outer membrane beta-barrel protein [Betaproteobacteria bacterium]
MKTRLPGLLYPLLTAAILVAPLTHAAEGIRLRTDVEFGYGAERLSNNTPDWQNIFVEGSHRFKDRHAVFGGLRATERFGLWDQEAYGSLHYPIAPTWNLAVEGSLSPAHEVLPKFTLGAQIQKLLPLGLIAGVGYRHNEYTRSQSALRTFSLERYWGDFRGAYMLFSGKPEGGGSAPAHRFQLNYYYGENVSSVGLSFTTGREVENVGAPAGLRTTDVRNWTISGRHWFARDWAVTYDLMTHRQGELYRRDGLRLGLRYRF